jgi:Tfp pilus assembly protein PilW
MKPLSPIPRLSRPPGRPAFSVIEMLVAVGILTIMMVGLLAMFNQTQKALRGSNAQTDVLESGRAIMDMLTREIQQATACNLSNGMNFYATRIAGADPLAQKMVASQPDRQNDLELFLLTRYHQNWQAVGFYVDQSENGVGTLYRFATNSPHEYTANLFPTYTSSKATLTNFYRVAEGLMHLEIHVYDRNGFVYTNMMTDTIIKTNNQAEFLSNALPYFVEVEFGVLEPEVLAQIKGMSASAARTFLEDKGARRLHLFRQRIPIRNAFAQ